MTSHLLQLNPSESKNSINGNLDALGLSDFSIKVANGTIALSMTITYKGANAETFTFNYPFILKIKNSNIQKIEFTDKNSYIISITQNLYTYDNIDDYELMLNNSSMEFIR